MFKAMMISTIVVLGSVVATSAAHASVESVCRSEKSNIEATVNIADGLITANVKVAGVEAEPISKKCTPIVSGFLCVSSLNGTRYEIYPSVVGYGVSQVGVVYWVGDVVGSALLGDCQVSSSTLHE